MKTLTTAVLVLALAAVALAGLPTPVQPPQGAITLVITVSNTPLIPTGSETGNVYADGSIDGFSWMPGGAIPRAVQTPSGPGVVFACIPGGPPRVAADLVFYENPPRRFYVVSEDGETIYAEGTW